MIEDTLKAIRALDILRIPQRLSRIERAQIWTVSGVRSINNVFPDDLGNVDVTSGSGDLTEDIANGLYIRLDGSNTPVTGDIIYPVTGFIITDSDSILWRVTILTTGVLLTEVVGAGGGVTMVGPWLSLGFTNIEHS